MRFAGLAFAIVISGCGAGGAGGAATVRGNGTAYGGPGGAGSSSVSPKTTGTVAMPGGQATTIETPDAPTSTSPE